MEFLYVLSTTGKVGDSWDGAEAEIATDFLEDPSPISLFHRPLVRGRLVPGGASKFTVQYDPKPVSVTRDGSWSKFDIKFE